MGKKYKEKSGINLRFVKIVHKSLWRNMLTQPPILQITNQLIDFYEMGILFITGWAKVNVVE